MRRIIFSILTLVMLTAMLPIQSAAAESGERCFPETGNCISGPIRAYWERNGGLPVFGYPITPVQVETIEGTWTGPTQWFERDRLEDHSAQGLGVLAGRLGAQYLELQGRPWVFGTQTGAAGCQFFPQTGYQMCGKFLAYWKAHGGLERFGYPITSLMEETINDKTYTVQYFERRRMELHPENAGTSYEVLLGLLGHAVNTIRNSPAECAVSVIWPVRSAYDQVASSTPLGCPVPGEDYMDRAATLERFERGMMFWVQLRGGRSIVYVVSYGPNNIVSVKKFDDTWTEKDPVDMGLKTPKGMVEPRYGFGKVWREQPGIRDAVGWALEIEQGAMASYQVFAQGEALSIHTAYDANPFYSKVWVFLSNGNARAFD